jgi:hypothetical protein
MSGGSWNFLFSKDADEILGDLSTMQAMRDRLVELDAEAAVINDMNTIIEHLEVARLIGDSAGMRRVWKEVEWKDSGDHGIERVRQAIWEYIGSPPCEHESRTEPQVSFMWLDDERRGSQARYQYCERCGARIILEKDVKL